MESEVWGHGGQRSETDARVGGGKPTLEADVCGFEFRSRLVEGGAGKKALNAAARQQVVDELMEAHPISERRACRVVKLSRHLRVYRPKRISEQVIMDEIGQVVASHPSWGCGKVYQALRRAGRVWNHKRVDRLYHQMGLHRRPKAKKRLPPRHPQPLSPSLAPNVCWSIDFMRDALSNGRAFRTFNVVDNFNRQALAIRVDTSLPSRKVTVCLDQIADERGYPHSLRLDNGSEFTAQHFKDWAKQHGILLDFTDPGCPYQNAYIERFNRTFREDVLDATWFDSLQEAQILADQWRQLYNEQRPHDALGGLTPLDFLAHASPPSLLFIGSI